MKYNKVTLLIIPVFFLNACTSTGSPTQDSQTVAPVDNDSISDVATINPTDTETIPVKPLDPPPITIADALYAEKQINDYLGIRIGQPKVSLETGVQSDTASAVWDIKGDSGIRITLIYYSNQIMVQQAISDTENNLSGFGLIDISNYQQPPHLPKNTIVYYNEKLPVYNCYAGHNSVFIHIEFLIDTYNFDESVNFGMYLVSVFVNKLIGLGY
jgi:hypothetical protein